MSKDNNNNNSDVQVEFRARQLIALERLLDMGIISLETYKKKEKEIMKVRR